MRKRLTFILMVVVLALVATGPYDLLSVVSETPDNEEDSLFKTLPRRHWAYEALKGLSETRPGEIQVLPGQASDQPVTRFELAVLLTRLMERIDQVGDGPSIPEDKLEIIEKLVREFRADLENIGVDVSGMDRRLTRLAKRVEKLEKGPDVRALSRKVEDTARSLAAQKAKVDEAHRQVAAVQKDLAAQKLELEGDRKKLKVYSEVLAKLLVKMASWEKEGLPGQDDTKQVARLASAVKDLTHRVQQAESAGGIARKQERHALLAVRDLLKDFTTDFEQRLSHLERGSPSSSSLERRMRPLDYGPNSPDRG